MYAAKEAGRGRYEVFHYEMARELGELLGLEHELRLGLQRGEFTRPLPARDRPRERRDRRRRGAAALELADPRRWSRPTGSSRVAEATGLILAARRVRAARGLRADRAAGGATACCRDRSSPGSTCPGRQLSSGGISTLVQRARSRTPGLPAACLGLEVTETAIVEEGAGRRAGARRARRSCTTLGVRIAIDDFGTGFSSLGAAAPLPGRHDQGRPLVRPGRRARRQGRRDHREPGQPRPRARAARDRRGHRVRQASSPRCASSAATSRRASCSPARCPRTRSGTSSRAASAT